MITDTLLSYLDIDIRRQGTRWHRGRTLPKPPTVVDVGIGRQGTPALYHLFPDARFILIDPLDECRRSVRRLLRRDANTFVTAALGAASGRATMNIAPDISQSSLLASTGAFGARESVATREVPVLRLDDVVAEHAPTGRLGLKVDTEGYELEVLAGATETLKRTEFVILEVNVGRRFEGGASFEETIAYMSGAGFYVHTVLHAGTRKCDIAFLPGGA